MSEKERLIKILKDNQGDSTYYMTDEAAQSVADVLLEKQIPKKGIMIGDNYSSILSCPNCRKPIVNVWNIAKYEPNYCHYCGQSLDWSDTK